MTAVPRVLLVTGAYYPEISASGIQCRTVAAALGDRVRFSVLTTALDAALPSVEVVDGVTVYRVPVDVRSRISKTIATVRLVGRLAGTGRSIDVFHVHGFSRKNVPVALMARLFRKPIVQTLHTAGQDEPDAIRRRGSLASWAFTSADLVLSVSPYLSRRYCDAGLPPARLRDVPNGIDTNRFQPASEGERAALRRELRWPDAQPVVLFVGFFSRDKRPDLLFRAWCAATRDGHSAALLVYVGATGQTYYEIDDSLARAIRTGAAEIGKTDRVLFVDPATDIEKYFRAADVFVLPSAREAHPLALLEAMACGMPCIATRLPGATDVIIDDGVNGRLCPADDEAAFAQALGDMLTDRASARTLGARARATVTARYDIRQTAERWRAAYDEVLA
jgi:glycosyltransferase involved in cell wall biosynthesis